jgi:hypothetical protein
MPGKYVIPVKPTIHVSTYTCVLKMRHHYPLHYQCDVSCDTSVTTVIDYGSDNRTSITGRSRDPSVNHWILTRSGAYPTSYLSDNYDSFLGTTANGA